jgi:CBS domain-containing protein
MDKYQTDVLPVVTHDAQMKLVGILSHKDIFTAYRKRRDEEGIHKRSISLRMQGIKIVIKGKQFLNIK